MKITVWDTDDLGSGGSLSRGHGDGLCTVPDGFPPYVWYELAFEPSLRHESRLLARGPVRSVWYERWTDTRKRFILGFLSDEGDSTEIALGWLAQMLEIKVEELPLKRRYLATHQWTTPAAYLAFAELRRSEVKRGAEALKAALLGARLLTKHEQAAIEIDPRFDVWDGREDQSESLPKIPQR
ncbi:MAG: hypothetical protein R3F05_16185 [Planctomycetota bacterium]